MLYGLLILNSDDDDVLAVKKSTHSRTLTYGFEGNAEILASNDQILYEEKNGVTKPVGVTCKINYAGSSVPLIIKGTLGRQHLYSGLAGVAVGLSQGLNLLQCMDALFEYNVSPGRMKIVEGLKNTTIIDDTYNSSPVALSEALNVFKDLKNQHAEYAVLSDSKLLKRLQQELSSILEHYIGDGS